MLRISEVRNDCGVQAASHYACNHPNHNTKLCIMIQSFWQIDHSNRSLSNSSATVTLG
jgi:hypothetical protein